MSNDQILSGKGGVGKSSTTVQLALALCLAGHQVGVLDVDLTGPSIPRLLGLEDAKVVQLAGGWQPVQVHPRHSFQSDANGQAIPEVCASTAELGSEKQGERDQAVGGLWATSLAFLLPTRASAVIWRGPKKTAMVRQFLTDVQWPKLDYLLIDTPPGTSDEHIALAEILLQQTATAQQRMAGAVVVTTPQAVAVADVKKELNFCSKVGLPILGVVENMSGFICECCGEMTNLFGQGGGELMAHEFGVRFLGRTPLDQGWGKVVEEGKFASYGTESTDLSKIDETLLVNRYRSCRLSAVFTDIAHKLVVAIGT